MEIFLLLDSFIIDVWQAMLNFVQLELLFQSENDTSFD